MRVSLETVIDGKPFDDGCVEFSGCAVPTRWCNHNDPQYGTSNHGIPCFGVRAIYDFFESPARPVRTRREPSRNA